jgi:predicted Co/Zn/Cd cation transporter (cation efflux family)
MDDILKKTMFEEIDAAFEQIEEIVQKYNMSSNIVYMGCVGVCEEIEEDTHEWQVKYTWNVKDTNELEEVVQLQVEAYMKTLPDDPLDFLYLN